jgi:hypothetical protein
VIDQKNFFQPAFVLSVTLLGHALQISNGYYDPRALAWLAVAFASALVGATTHARSEARHNERLVHVLLYVSIAWQLTQLLSTSPGDPEFAFSQTTGLGRTGASGALLAASRNAVYQRRLVSRRADSPTLAGAWMFRASPDRSMCLGSIGRDPSVQRRPPTCR